MRTKHLLPLLLIAASLRADPVQFTGTISKTLDGPGQVVDFLPNITDGMIFQGSLDGDVLSFKCGGYTFTDPQAVIYPTCVYGYLPAPLITDDGEICADDMVYADDEFIIDGTFFRGDLATPTWFTLTGRVPEVAPTIILLALCLVPLFYASRRS